MRVLDLSDSHDHTVQVSDRCVFNLQDVSDSHNHTVRVSDRCVFNLQEMCLTVTNTECECQTDMALTHKKMCLTVTITLSEC